MAEDCVDRVLRTKYAPYNPGPTPFACTYVAAKRLVAIREETKKSDPDGGHVSLDLAEAFDSVRAIRQTTHSNDTFGTDPD